MNTTKSATGMQTSSEKAILLVGRPAKNPPPSPGIAELNARMNADPARITRLARANTQRLAGKPIL